MAAVELYADHQEALLRYVEVRRTHPGFHGSATICTSDLVNGIIVGPVVQGFHPINDLLAAFSASSIVPYVRRSSQQHTYVTESVYF